MTVCLVGEWWKAESRSKLGLEGVAPAECCEYSEFFLDDPVSLSNCLPIPH